MSKGMRVLAEDCDPSVSDDKSLPTDAFMVEYIVEGLSKFDLVRSGKKVDIFDEYYDKYKKNLINITQAEGRISPKLWGNEPPKSKNKKRK